VLSLHTALFALTLSLTSLDAHTQRRRVNAAHTTHPSLAQTHHITRVIIIITETFSHTPLLSSLSLSLSLRDIPHNK